MGFHLFLHGWWCSCSVFFLFIICIIVVNLWTLCTFCTSVHNIFVKHGKIWSKSFIKRTQINHPFSRKFFFCTILYYILNRNKIKYINNVLMVCILFSYHLTNWKGSVSSTRNTFRYLHIHTLNIIELTDNKLEVGFSFFYIWNILRKKGSLVYEQKWKWSFEETENKKNDCH